MDYSRNASHIGETKKTVLIRTTEYQREYVNGIWQSSGETEHCFECHGQLIG